MHQPTADPSWAVEPHVANLDQNHHENLRRNAKEGLEQKKKKIKVYQGDIVELQETHILVV